MSHGQGKWEEKKPTRWCSIQFNPEEEGIRAAVRNSRQPSGSSECDSEQVTRSALAKFAGRIPLRGMSQSPAGPFEPAFSSCHFARVSSGASVSGRVWDICMYTYICIYIYVCIYRLICVQACTRAQFAQPACIAYVFTCKTEQSKRDRLVTTEKRRSTRTVSQQCL